MDFRRAQTVRLLAAETRDKTLATSVDSCGLEGSRAQLQKRKHGFKLGSADLRAKT